MLLLAQAPAQATVIGTTVRGLGYSTQVGDVNSDGSVNFYALLNGSATYGVSGGGLSADTCTISNWTNNCGGGVLDMWFRFNPVTLGQHRLTLSFTDLDLAGVNDPAYFFETLEIFGADGTSLAFVEDEDDPQVVDPLTNDTNQVIRLIVNVNTTPTFYLHTQYVTHFDGAPKGTYTNTVERVRATVASVGVPEPGTLSLLGAGLVAAGLIGRRRRKSLAS